MAEQKQGDQLEPTYSSSVKIRGAAPRTCRKRWTIGRGDERGSGISALMARQDDDDISSAISVWIVFLSHSNNCGGEDRVFGYDKRTSTILNRWHHSPLLHSKGQFLESELFKERNTYENTWLRRMFTVIWVLVDPFHKCMKTFRKSLVSHSMLLIYRIYFLSNCVVVINH